MATSARRRPRSLLAAVLAVSSLMLGTGDSRAFQAPDPPPAPDFDVRLPTGPAARDGFILRRPAGAQLAEAGVLEAALPGLTLRWDGMSGSPRWLAAPSGLALTAPSAKKPEEAAREFLAGRARLFGLGPPAMDQGLRATSSVLMAGGAHVHFQQMIEELEVHGGRILVNLAPDGAAISAGGSLFAGLEPLGPPALDPAEATRIAALDVYPHLLWIGAVASSKPDGDRRTVFADPGFGRPPEARLILFPEASGARLAWEVRVAETTLITDYRILVDAADGRILQRRNMTLYGSARILDASWPEPQSEEVAPAQHQLVPLPASTPESPQGWLSGAGTNLEGNNATSHRGFWTEPGLSDSSAVYDYDYNTLPAALANAWYWANDAHDRMYALGFTEAAGNYQMDNFGQGGVAGDPMRVVAWSGAGARNNAFYSPSVDGGVSSVNFLWVNCAHCRDHDGYPETGGERSTAFMRDVIVHEYVHGVSTRLVGGPAIDDCLMGVQSGAMGEAWSDLFAASFTGEPRLGEHFFEGSGWMRDPRQDLTYAWLCEVHDFGCEVHADGMIWLGALWDLRQSMIALDPANGLDRFHRIVVEGMAGTPCYPSMLDARDAILAADAALYGSAHHPVIWASFAGRGLGSDASSTGDNDIDPVAGTSIPAGMECTPPAPPTGPTAAATGPQAIRITYSAAEAAAIAVWRDDLDNPLDGAQQVALAANTGAFDDTSVQGGRAYQYHLVALGPAGLSCDSTPSGTVSATATGNCQAFPVFAPGLVISDGDPSCLLTLSWNVALPGCAGEPVVYNVYRAAAPGYEPSEALLIGRTAETTFQDSPPGDGLAYYYLVLAQHGTLADPADHRDRRAAQVLRWVPRLPLTGRTTAKFWGFESGPAGWTASNTFDPAGAWTLAQPQATHYGGSTFAPGTAAGGAGYAWVTGDPSGTTVTEHDSDGLNILFSPTWNGLGAMIISFDYWAHLAGDRRGSLDLAVQNGTAAALVRITGAMTAQDFDTASLHGWQHAELDLARYVTPTATMQIQFRSGGGLLAEYGVDNVRVEGAASCLRPALAIDSVSVDDTAPAWGNGNAVLEPGETARLRVTLGNDGGAMAPSPVGVISGASPSLLVHEGTDSFPDIPPGGSAASAGGGFTITSPETACGESLNLDFELTDAAGRRSSASWTFELGQAVTYTLLQDTFETDIGWYPDPQGPGAGAGIWQHGDPVGTTVGGQPANPENDSPNDAGSKCWVTENGPIGGQPGASDVDATWTPLHSPLLDFTGYKRARLSFDLWYYDNSASDSFQDFAQWSAFVDGVLPWGGTLAQHLQPTGGWTPMTASLTDVVPMTSDVRLRFQALDQDGTWIPGGQDHVVEMGVDNVLVQADLPTCDSPGPALPPNGAGDSLRLGRAGDAASLAWAASPVDATHDAAAYYVLHVSFSPSGGFNAADTATVTATSRPLAGADEYYLVSAVNAAGTSADEPAP